MNSPSSDNFKRRLWSAFLRIIVVFLSVAYPKLAAGSSCSELFRTDSLGTSATGKIPSQFENLVIKYFAPNKTTHDLAEGDGDFFNQQFIKIYSKLTVSERKVILNAIKMSYYETKVSKNLAYSSDVFLSRVMDVFINLEIDRIAVKFRSVKDLKAAFSKMNQLVGETNVIKFESVISTAAKLRELLNDRNRMLRYLNGAIERSERLREAVRGMGEYSDKAVRLVKEVEKSTDNISLWILGSVANGRGIKNISDLDIKILPEDFESIVSDYVSFSARIDDTVQAFQVSEISSFRGIGKQTPVQSYLMRSRWAIEVTSTEITILVFDPQTNRMRRLPWNITH